MWPVIRRYRNSLKHVILGSILFVVIIQLKWTANFGGDYLKRANFKVQFYQVRKYSEILDYLQSINITLTVLDPAMLTYGELDESHVIFGIFENQSYRLRKYFDDEKKTQSKFSLENWVYKKHMELDYRILNIVRIKSYIPAHYTFQSKLFDGVLHLAVIFNRGTHPYFWVPEFTDHDFPAKNYSIPMPMAVEHFDCKIYNASDRHTVCLPLQRNHYLWQLRYASFLECQYENVVWKFEREFPLEIIDLRPHASAIAEMMRIGRKFEVPIMLAYGSLLGWYRQCSYIVHSKDIDTKMFASDFNEAIFRELWFSPLLRMYVRLGNLEQGLEFRFFAANTVWFDLFMIYPTPKGDVYYTYMIHTILQELHRSTYPMLKDICSAELLGVLVYLPCNPMTNILTEYGPENWFSHKSWNYLNIEVVHKWNDSVAMYSNIHNYKKDCQYPTIDKGCDYDEPVAAPTISRKSRLVDPQQQTTGETVQENAEEKVAGDSTTSAPSDNVDSDNKFDLHSAWNL